jgi:uncharacterized repeat protein (TIGR03803 family)
MRFSNVLAAVTALLLSAPAGAQTVEVLKAFRAYGGEPNALVKGTDGAFYGTTVHDGDFAQGTVFRIDALGSLTTLHSFDGTDGRGPAGLVEGSGGVFYGTTFNGGAHGYGAVYRIDAEGNFTLLHSFGGADGAYPGPLIRGSDGAVYGTSNGSGSRYGTIFRIDSTGVVTNLYTFDGTHGRYPTGMLVEGSAGTFYGITRYGYGAVFKYVVGDGCTTVHTFVPSEGYAPRIGPTRASDGSLYGVTPMASTGTGSVYRIGPGDAFTTLHVFASAEGGALQDPLVEGTDGALYGTAGTGGASNKGTVFRIDAAGAFTVLHSFSGIDGDTPTSPLLSSAEGALYGTTSKGGSSDAGTVFRITGPSDAFAFTSLHSFARDDGWKPQTALVAGDDGAFYGTTTQGGSLAGGTVFRIGSDGAFASLYAFNGVSEGASPRGPLIQGSDGAFYGTTAGGGAATLGTVFRIEAEGAFTTLHAFDGSDGGKPNGALVEGVDGAFYGTTPRDTEAHREGSVFAVDRLGTFTSLKIFTWAEGSDPIPPLRLGNDGALYGATALGGPAYRGTVYRIDSLGAYTLLHAFDANGGWYLSQPPIFGSDGALYGTTEFGGGTDNGTVFRVETDGSFTPLHSFDGLDGSAPSSPLVEAADGVFYGTTEYGGPSMNGTIFRLDSAGLTSLHSFETTDGFYPNPLTRAGDGAFYGGTWGGGASSLGTLHRVDPSGGFTLLRSLSEIDGAYVGAPLLLGRDGGLYGVTNSRGAKGAGTIFRLDVDGTFTVLHSFDPAVTGQFAEATLIQGSDGAFYGVTVAGGPHGGGTVFRLSIPLQVRVSGPGRLCGGAVLLTAKPMGGTGSYSYQWYRNGVRLPKQTSSSCSASKPGSYTVAIADTAGASAESATAVLETAPTPTASVSGSAGICAGGEAVIEAALGGTPPWDVTWSDGFVQTALVTSPATRTVSPSTTTTYTVTSVSDAVCVGGASGQAVVTVVSPSSVIAAPSSLCGASAGNEASVPSAGAGATYAWTISGGTITSSAATSAIRFTAGSSGEVTLGVTVTAGQGCSSSSSLVVPIVEGPSGLITTNAVACLASTGNTAAVPDAGPGATYVWSLRNGTITSGQGSPSITFTAGAKTMTLSVTITTPGGCSATTTATIRVIRC